MIQVEVLRPIPAGDHTLQRGEVVDATNWRNLERLVSLGKCRYVVAVPDGPSQRTDLTAGGVAGGFQDHLATEAISGPRRTARGGS